MSKACHVYIVGHEHPIYGHAVKVGITEALSSRISQLQTGSCEDLILFFSFSLPDKSIAAQVEGFFHQAFQHFRIRGEWFRMPPDGALMLLSFAVSEFLHYAYPWRISDARREAGMQRAFDILDHMPSADQERWNDEWAAHVS